jgi:hypothetical protein
LHPSRQLHRRRLGLLGQVEPVDEVVDRRSYVSGAQSAKRGEVLEVLPDVQAPVDGAVALEDGGQLPRRDPRRPHGVDAVDGDRSRRRRDESADRFDRRRLAGSVGAEEPDDLARRDLEGHIVEGDEVTPRAAPVGLRQPLDRENRGPDPSHGRPVLPRRPLGAL